MDVRKDFPVLENNEGLIYFDAAASSLKPKAVIDAITHYYSHYSVNVFRGDYQLSIKTSEMYEAVRQKVAKFLNVKTNNIIFTSGASASLNLAAQGFAKEVLNEGDVILVNEAEHASNVLPWFNLAETIGAKVEFLAIKNGQLDLVQLEEKLKQGAKLVSLAHVSNVLGVVNDIKTVSEIVHKYDAYLIVDGAQSVGHTKIDLKDLDVDLFAFSAHKMFGPTGVGVLYGKPEILEMMKPVSFGGGSNARFNVCGNVTLKEIPQRFESGTPNIEGVIGFGAAIDYINELGLEKIIDYEKELLDYLLEKISKLDNVKVYNPYTETNLISFNVDGIFAQDLAAYLDTENICVRSGMHCAKLVGGIIEEENTVRLSFSIYNTKEEIDKFIELIKDVSLEKTIDAYL